MEKYSKTCRFIMWCRSLKKVIEPLKSRCYCVRVPSPKNDELFTFVHSIALKEKINLTLDDYSQILKYANGRIKKALWMLEFKKIKMNDTTTTYEIIIDEIVKKLLKFDLKNIASIRLLLYNIMITNINGSQIIRSVLEKLLPQLKTDQQKIAVVEKATQCEHRLLLGRREINHLEAFIIGTFDIIHYEKIHGKPMDQLFGMNMKLLENNDKDNDQNKDKEKDKDKKGEKKGNKKLRVTTL